MQSGVGQLVAVCGLFLWGGEKNSGNGLCGGRVATVAAVCRNKKDYAIIKEQQKNGPCKVLDTS